jgi:hypothetical protein
MPHVLARLTDVNLDDVRRQLQQDAAQHAEQGMHLERLWTNAEAAGEVLFLFRADDLEASRQRIRQAHAQAREANPEAKLPEMLFLAE